MKCVLDAWRVFRGEFRKNHWTEVDFPVKWAVWIIAAMLAAGLILLTSGLGLIGVLYLYGLVIVFDFYLACREEKSAFSVFCRQYDSRRQVNLIYWILTFWSLLITVLTMFLVLVVQFNRGTKELYLFYSNIYEFLMMLFFLYVSAPLIFIRIKKLWKLWAAASLISGMIFHILIWENLRGRGLLILDKVNVLGARGAICMALALCMTGIALIVGYYLSCHYNAIRWEKIQKKITLMKS